MTQTAIKRKQPRAIDLSVPVFNWSPDSGITPELTDRYVGMIDPAKDCFHALYGYKVKTEALGAVRRFGKEAGIDPMQVIDFSVRMSRPIVIGNIDDPSGTGRGVKFAKRREEKDDEVQPRLITEVDFINMARVTRDLRDIFAEIWQAGYEEEHRRPPDTDGYWNDVGFFVADASRFVSKVFNHWPNLSVVVHPARIAASPHPVLVASINKLCAPEIISAGARGFDVEVDLPKDWVTRPTN